MPGLRGWPGQVAWDAAHVLGVIGEVLAQETFLMAGFGVEKNGQDGGENHSGGAGPEQGPAESHGHHAGVKRMSQASVDPGGVVRAV